MNTTDPEAFGKNPWCDGTGAMNTGRPGCLGCITWKIDGETPMLCPMYWFYQDPENYSPPNLGVVIAIYFDHSVLFLCFFF